MKKQLDELTIGKIREIANIYAKQDDAFKLIKDHLVYNNDFCCFVVKGQYSSSKLDDFLKSQKKKYEDRAHISLSFLKRTINSGKTRLKRGRKSDSSALRNKVDFEYHGYVE